MSLKNVIQSFLQSCDGCVASLKEIYGGIKEDYIFNTKTPENSVRRTLYTNEETFKRLAKGVYALASEGVCSLLIEGDGRNLEFIEDDSIELIITDHPYVSEKSHKGGNRDFASYTGFQYTQQDFYEKARVLKEHSYLIEFLPVESATNFEYLSSIKQMAASAGFQYYTSLVWNKGFACNTGRCTKGFEQVIIWSKGTPKRLAPLGKPYMAKIMLPWVLDFPISRNKRIHQAEKPVELYKFLIEQFTNEYDVCLDSFVGSGNFLKACSLSKRFGIGIEVCKEYIKNIIARYNLETIFTLEKDDTEETSYQITKDGQLALAI